MMISHALLILAMISGGAPDTAAFHPAWPAPPDHARIRHVRTLASGADLEAHEGMFSRLLGMVFGSGSSHPWLVQPVGIAVSEEGLLAVADPGAHGVHLIDPGKNTYRLITETSAGLLHSPVGVAFAGDGALFVTDADARCVAVYDDDGDPERVITPDVGRPTGILVAGDSIIVVDTDRHRLLYLERAGRVLGTAGGRGTAPGTFNYPVQLTGTDTLFVVDALNYRVQLLQPGGRFLSAFGSMGTGAGTFAAPKAIARDTDGHLYVTDALFDTIQIFSTDGRLLLVVGRRGTADGEFMSPGGITIDRHDRIYVVDTLNRRIQIFQYMR